MPGRHLAVPRRLAEARGLSLATKSREQTVLGWLRRRGCGLFSYGEIAAELGITRDQAWVACLALADTGTIDYMQRIEHYGTDTFELRSVKP